MLPPAERVVLISGATRGIGASVAEALHAAGYTLSLGARNVDALRDSTSAFDAEDRASQTAWVDETVRRFGRIDALVNNAGTVVRVQVEDDNDEALDRMWAVNVKAPLAMTRLCLPHLRRAGSGRVINVASIAGKAVYNNNAGYAMSKSAAVTLSHATRRAGWEDGVRCTALCPGFVRTEMTADVETFPIDEMMDPGDIAQIVALLIALPNTASVAELVVNCRDDVTY